MTRNTVEFYLGQKLVRINEPHPTTTLHKYLRDQPRRKGTKEGCAEGDCGACTVLLGELLDGKLIYKAVNSCILFVSTLDGKQVVTVEDLADGDKLHPTQQAMVDYHGSQCGYCTPGFIMSLTALYEDGPNANRKQIDDALSGNLCRCTGYGPIIEAARAMHEYPAVPDLREGVNVAALERVTTDSMVVEKPGATVFAPRTADELARIYSENPDATILAGGTDVGIWVTKLQRKLGKLIYLGNVDDLKSVNIQEHVIEIYAGVTIEQARPVLEQEYPGLCTLLRRFASKPIRNSGTVCGNIANGSPIGDLPPPFIALGAKVVLRKGDARRELALEDFFVSYGKQDRQDSEFIEKIVLPRLQENENLKAIKISKRFDQDISAVCAAMFTRRDPTGKIEAQIAYGGMAATPMRASKAEAVVNSDSFNQEQIERAARVLAEDFNPLSDMRASAEYRMKSAQNALKRM